jgi:hypothetical protein
MSMKRSLQRELDSFFGKLSQADFDIREVTKGAFSKARSKLDPSVFVHLNRIAIKEFYSTTEVYTWEEMRILSVDGTRMMLPNHPSVRADFGVHCFGPKADSERSLATCSLLYDTLNKVTLDSQIAPYSQSESSLLDKHLDSMLANDLLLLDRGYPSFKLIFKLHARGIHFCMRMKANWWHMVDEFIRSEKTETIIKVKLPKKDRKELSDFPEVIDREISCRLVKVISSQGTVVLCTSLLDKEQFPVEVFQSLYDFRWEEEEPYKMLKCRVEVEDFTGKTSRAVQQDFHAKIFMMNLCAMFVHPIDEKVREEFSSSSDDRKYGQKINWTNAVSVTKSLLVNIFCKQKILQALHHLDDLVYRTREPIRMGRHVERNFRPRRRYYMNYKTL